MKSRSAALGGRRHTVLLAGCALAVVALLGTAGPAPARVAPPPPSSPSPPPPGIGTPMTGILPVCPAQLHDSVSHDVWVELEPGDPFDANHEAGLDQNCAWQGMQDRVDSSSWPRGVNARAEPDTVPINSTPTTVRFVVDAATAAGPFNSPVPGCMPLSTRPGGCSADPDPTPYVAYRLANGAGQFAGRWKLVATAGDNPYFDLTRDTLGCADNYANWDANYPHTGLPCDYELNFNLANTGAPILTSAMQVIVGIRWLTGTKTVNGHTGYDYGYTAVVPMLFTPGGSTSLKLDALPGTVPYGTALSLRSTAVGPPPGSAVNFYRRAGGAGAGTLLGQALTDGSGVASLATTATGNAEYWTRLVSGGTETAQSEVRSLLVTRGINLATKKKPRSKALFTATLTPGTGTGTVQLQRKDKKKGWVTVRSASPASTLAWTLKPPKGKSLWRVLLPAGADFAASVSPEAKVKRPS